MITTITAPILAAHSTVMKRPVSAACISAGALLGLYLARRAFRPAPRGWQPPPLKDMEKLISVYDIKVVRCERTCEQWIRETFGLKSDGDQFPECVIGFDAEWSMNGKVAVVQIATGHRCVVIQLLCIGSVPPLLAKLFKSQSVIKVGVCVGGDARRIERDWGVHLPACVELSWLQSYRRVQLGRGLKKMSELILYHQYSHELISVRVSNWEAAQLSKNHIRYAAADAIVGFQIAVSLFYMVNGIPGLPVISPTVHELSGLYTFCRDAPQVSDAWFPSVVNTPSARPADKPLLGTGGPREVPKGTRKQQMFNNVPVYSHDGEFLALCQKKKVAKALVSDGIAVPREGSPFSLQFLVDVGTTDEFHKTFIENKCVNCGTTEFLTLHHITPVTYYKRLHRLEYVHDTVLLCVPCSTNVKARYREEMQRIAEEYGVPVDGVNSKKQIKAMPMFLAKQNAKAILVHYLRSKKLYKSEKDRAKEANKTRDNGAEPSEVNENYHENENVNDYDNELERAEEHERDSADEGNGEEKEDTEGAPKQGTAEKKKEKAVYRMQITGLLHSFSKLSQTDKNTPVLASTLRIPAERLTFMLQAVETYTGTPAAEVTFQMLMDCMVKLEPSLEFFSHGAMVTQYLDTREKKDLFLRRWRDLFLSCAPMTHMPPLWRVDYVATDCLLLRLINALDITPFPVPILPSGLEFSYKTPYSVRDKIKIGPA